MKKTVLILVIMICSCQPARDAFVMDQKKKINELQMELREYKSKHREYKKEKKAMLKYINELKEIIKDFDIVSPRDF